MTLPITHSEQRSFTARMDHLVPATAFVEAFCELHGIAPGDALRLRLVVEELFTNTVKHGHRGDSDALIGIEISVGVAELALRYEDSAPTFDPLQHLANAPPELDAAIDERGPGGLGVHLLVRMAQSVRYEYVDGLNRIQLVLRRES
jgi:serine/threonine-protein kinase RsbW